MIRSFCNVVPPRPVPRCPTPSDQSSKRSFSDQCPPHFGPYRVWSSRPSHVGIPFATVVSIPGVLRPTIGPEHAHRPYRLRLVTDGLVSSAHPGLGGTSTSIRKGKGRKAALPLPPVHHDFSFMALHPLHAPCLFQLPLLAALGMASSSNNIVYPTPPAPQPAPAVARAPRHFPPERYVLCSACIVGCC